ncbi:LacI family DNA-binding transcriptional regulator [Alkalicoccus halolimnae]|uniref:LacI family DNA-binding transcriptional regulator n=1 Tax=Alkalicoccus halolimnae TaxID=1667239 RepID=A0A5C7FKG9_9BACI|nr:LacI family DNA-binding transcriptional regulator [Alkalicoccus halolimnae]TXF85305.1 LacI family transcriptional regulator [Alkalicoccus halolimnae]
MKTIRDVAKQAEVSVATVSRVVNNSGYVSEKTRKKVINTIELLGYKPNSVAQSLYNKSSKTVGLIVPDITNPFFPEISRAVEDVMNEKGYTVILCNSDASPQKEENYFDVLSRKYIDGMIVVTNETDTSYLDHYKLPIVALDRPFSKLPSIYTDNISGAEIAMNHLYECGCQKIAHICGPRNIVNAVERLNGYKKSLNKLNFNHLPIVVDGEYQWRTSEKSVMELLNDDPSIDGIFAGNDIMAVGALKAAQKLGVSVPSDLQIIGFDGIELSKMMVPSLTTIRQPLEEIGTLAAQTLIYMIEEGKQPNALPPFIGKLQQGETTMIKE